MVSAYAIFNLQADVVSRWQQKLYRKEEVAEHISNALEQHTMTSIPLIPRPAAVQYKRRIFAPHAQHVKRNISMLYNGLCHLKKSIAIRLHQYHSTIWRSANTIMVLLLMSSAGHRHIHTEYSSPSIPNTLVHNYNQQPVPVHYVL